MITLRTRECIYREVKVGMIALANPSRDEIGLAAKYKVEKMDNDEQDAHDKDSKH